MPIFRGYRLCLPRLRLRRMRAERPSKLRLDISPRRHRRRPSQNITSCHTDHGRRLRPRPTPRSPCCRRQSARHQVMVLLRGSKNSRPLNAPRRSLQGNCMAPVMVNLLNQFRVHHRSTIPLLRGVGRTHQHMRPRLALQLLPQPDRVGSLKISILWLRQMAERETRSRDGRELLCSRGVLVGRS
jgi:hypothetical protein